jgi:hypothetical protein
MRPKIGRHLDLAVNGLQLRTCGSYSNIDIVCAVAPFSTQLRRLADALITSQGCTSGRPASHRTVINGEAGSNGRYYRNDHPIGARTLLRNPEESKIVNRDLSRTQVHFQLGTAIAITRIGMPTLPEPEGHWEERTDHDGIVTIGKSSRRQIDGCGQRRTPGCDGSSSYSSGRTDILDVRKPFRHAHLDEGSQDCHQRLHFWVKVFMINIAFIAKMRRSLRMREGVSRRHLEISPNFKS